MKRVLVVGAGIASGVLAQTLSPHFDLTVLEKSRGPGGRLSTRRIDALRFNHGSPRSVLPEVVAGVPTTETDTSAVIRKLLEPATVLYETRVKRVELGRVWAVDGRCFETDWIVLTAPLPQVSQIIGRPTTVVYDGCWVAMVSGPRDAPGTARQDPAGWTAICGETFGQTTAWVIYGDAPSPVEPPFQACSTHRWRYANVRVFEPEPFWDGSIEGWFACGDGFSGESLPGVHRSIESATALAQHLLKLTNR